MTRIGYYPGCALHGSSNDFEASVRACMKVLGEELGELNDWICCGATAAHSINHKLSLALPGRNLGIAEREGFTDLLAPCPMCSMELIKTKKALADNSALRAEISEIVETPINGTTEVINLIQVFQRIGLDRIQAVVKKPLDSVNAACYYGCLLTRPPRTVAFDDAEKPRSMEAILAVLGANAVEWNYATECCGAGMTMSREETVLSLSNKIITNAKAHGANCLVVACPMCHVNLDMKQAAVEQAHGVKHDMPVYYLSDLVGLALGLGEKELGVNRHFVRAGVHAAPKAVAEKV